MNDTCHDIVSQSILKTLLYFDIFDYPLNSKEIFNFLQTNHVTEKIIEERLRVLANTGFTFKFGKFFSLHNNAALVDRRLKGNKEAMHFMDLARKQARLIHKFPFVSAVMASGSLSKGYMDESCDLDFFIITQSNRLWIARTLLVLYKRIFLGNSHKYFCVNYFVDENNLEIEEKNLFTATELTTLIPLSGVQYQKKLMNENKWVANFLPNYTTNYNDQIEELKPPLKKIQENILNLLFPYALNYFFMWITLNRWRKLYERKYSEEDFKVAFKTKQHVSKNHPNYYQKKVMERYAIKKDNFSKQHSLGWKI